MSSTEQPRAIDLLLDQAFEAIGRGDRATANVLAEQVLALDSGNAEAEDLLAAPEDQGEIRRLTIMFADLVDSTALSTHVEPEIYRTVVGRYRREVTRIVERYEGHLGSTKGDGMLAFFGHPHAHEDDVKRALQAGLDITREVSALSAKVRRRFGFDIDVRVGIHHGIVYLDIAEDDVYGLAANLAARICTLAEPGTVAVSESIERLVRDAYELEARLPRTVKGVEAPIRSYRVVAERETSRIRSGELVGRDREAEYLDQSWTRARAGTLPQPGVMLQGEAGLGKSRLAWSTVEMAEKSHAVVLSLIGSPFHTDVGLRPVRRLLERRCGIGRSSEPAERLRHLRRELDKRLPDREDLVPLLAPVLGITTGYQPASAEGRKLYELIVGGVRDYLLACVKDVPALILAEDMHWFDEDTVELVQTLLDTDLGGHVLVVMTSRRERPLPEGSAEIFDLKPLTNAEADRLIMSLHPEATSEQRRAVRRRSDGVPLYIEEIVAKLKERPSDSASPIGVPDTLYEALFARIRSSTNAVRVCEAAAIAGHRFDRHLLHAVVDLNTEQIDQAIDQLTASQVLQQIESETWRFRHELLREVAAELSPPAIRRRLHSRFADALMDSSTDGNPDWPLIARHYANAERFAEAATAYAHAATNAAHRGALGESRNYLTHAIAQIEQAPPGEERDKLEIKLRLERGRLAYAAEGAASQNAADDFERCLQLSGTDLHSDETFATLTALYGYYAMLADLDRVEVLLSSIRLSMEGRDWFIPFNDAGFGMLAWYRGEFDKAHGLLARAAQANTEAGAHALEAIWYMPNEGTASIHTHLALARYIQGDFAGAEADFARTLTRCEGLEFPQGPFSQAYALQMQTLVRIDAGQLDRAAESAGRLAAVGEQHGFDSWAFAGAVQQGFIAALVAAEDGTADADQLSQQISALNTFVEMWRSLGVISLITTYEAMVARLQIAVGHLAEARQRVEGALQLTREIGMRYHDVELLRIRARTHDDEDLRHAVLIEAMALARKQKAQIYLLRCAIDDFEIGGAKARETLAAVVEQFPADSGWPELARARALLQ